MTNKEIVCVLKAKVKSLGMSYMFVSKKTGIEYQRLQRIFNHNATLSAVELLELCKYIGIDPKYLSPGA